jgi:transposase InsO family protein
VDNAVVEGVMGSLQRERPASRHYLTRQAAKETAIDDLEMCYNSTRKHPYLGSISPHEFEAIALAA